jgi:hypothetical protein
MATISHDPAVLSERRQRSLQLFPREAWASLAIAVIWLAVLFDAIFGPDIMNRSAGGDSSIVPSAVPVAICAAVGTWFVAKYGLRRRHDDE